MTGVRHIDGDPVAIPGPDTPPPHFHSPKLKLTARQVNYSSLFRLHEDSSINKTNILKHESYPSISASNTLGNLKVK
jgi:hypothetical protein